MFLYLFLLTLGEQANPAGAFAGHHHHSPITCFPPAASFPCLHIQKLQLLNQAINHAPIPHHGCSQSIKNLQFHKAISSTVSLPISLHPLQLCQATIHSLQLLSTPMQSDPNSDFPHHHYCNQQSHLIIQFTIAQQFHC